MEITAIDRPRFDANDVDPTAGISFGGPGLVRVTPCGVRFLADLFAPVQGRSGSAFGGSVAFGSAARMVEGAVMPYVIAKFSATGAVRIGPGVPPV